MYNLSNPSINKFKHHIIKGADLLGIKVSTDQADLMLLHAKELIAWNKKINLTAIKDPFKIAEKHFIDSITASGLLRNKNHLMDMGAGGGFPGIPIKIINPSLHILLIDASRKKVNFLKHVIRTLQLKNIDAVHSRVEDLHENKRYKGKFDGVISRAFTELSGFLSLATPFLNKTGSIYAMKGKKAETEITSDILKSFKLDTHHYQLPYEKSDRCLIKLSAK